MMRWPRQCGKFGEKIRYYYDSLHFLTIALSLTFLIYSSYARKDWGRGLDAVAKREEAVFDSYHEK